VEEEANVTKVIEAIKMVGHSGTALYMVDRQLAARA
jgi:ferritin